MIKKVLITIFSVLLLGFLGLLLYSYYNKDKIIDLFIAEANRSINTPIDVESFDFSLIKNFPHLSVSMHGVKINESTGQQNGRLGSAGDIHFNFNLWDLIGGSYTIDEVTIVDGDFKLRVDKNGKTNYEVIKARPDSSRNSRLNFSISSINLNQVSVRYSLDKASYIYQFSAEKLNATWDTENNTHKVRMQGNLRMDTLSVNGLNFGARLFAIDGEFETNPNEGTYSISPSQIQILNSQYSVSGSISKEDYSIVVYSDNADLESLTSFIPEKNQKIISRYNSKGGIVFSAEILKPRSKPVGIRINFTASDASIYYPEYKKSLENLSLKGRYVLSDLSDYKLATLSIENFKGTMEGKPTSGNLSIKNFSNYPIKMQLTADLDLKDLLGFYPVSTIKNPKGALAIDIDIEGVLKGDSRKDPLKASGEIDLSQVGFTWIKSPAMFRDLKGNFIFNNEDIAISDFSGYWGRSDFLINGFLKNVLQKFVEPQTRINVQADLNSNFIDLDELLAIEQKDQKDTLFQFNIPKEIGLSFKCKVNRLNMGRFKSRNNYGNLEVYGQKAKLSQVSFNIAGGKVDLDAEIDAMHPDSVFVYSQTAYDRIDVDSIFYIFENFNQTFLEERHLKGQVYANVNSRLDFDRYLNLNKNTFKTEASFSIRNGELNDFEPMQKLSKYLGGQSLDHLLFSDLENQVLINRQTIFLPEMAVRSNVTNIEIRGTHTFDQHIDYYLKLPLSRTIKHDKDEAFGAIEDDGTGQAMLFLTIRGTTDEYKIAYDTRSVKKKILSDIRKEGKELKEVFKNKGLEKEKTVELEEEDYFDFEEDTVSSNKN